MGFSFFLIIFCSKPYNQYIFSDTHHFITICQGRDSSSFVHKRMKNYLIFQDTAKWFAVWFWHHLQRNDSNKVQGEITRFGYQIICKHRPPSLIRVHDYICVGKSHTIRRRLSCYIALIQIVETSPQTFYTFIIYIHVPKWPYLSSAHAKESLNSKITNTIRR